MNIRDDPSNIVAEFISLTVADERTVAVAIQNSVLSEEGKYYLYLVYGGSSRKRTDAVIILGDKKDSKENVANAGLIVGIVIAVVAVVILIVVIVVFLVWRNNEIKKRTTESAAEQTMEGAQFDITLI
jgi:hypothetical protein